MPNFFLKVYVRNEGLLYFEFNQRNNKAFIKKQGIFHCRLKRNNKPHYDKHSSYMRYSHITFLVLNIAPKLNVWEGVFVKSVEQYCSFLNQKDAELMIIYYAYVPFT